MSDDVLKAWERFEKQKVIFGVIAAEMERGREKHGGDETDDTNNVHQWVSYITRQLGGCVFYVRELPEPVRAGDDARLIRRQMVKVAALAVSCILAMDRRIGAHERFKPAASSES